MIVRVDGVAWNKADAIVTFNIRDFGQVAARFGIEVLSPGEAWKRVEKSK